MKKSNVISMPMRGKLRKKTRKKKIRNVDGVKYFTEKQIKMLRRTVRDQAVLDKKNFIIKNYALFDLSQKGGIIYLSSIVFIKFIVWYPIRPALFVP